MAIVRGPDLVRRITVDAGRPLPLGATVSPDGINFSIFSRHATAMTLVLFRDLAGWEEERAGRGLGEGEGDPQPPPAAEIHLDPEVHRTGDIWHIFVRRLESRFDYGWRADGPFQPRPYGLRFNRNKLLLDPYARALEGTFDWDSLDLLGYEPGPLPDDMTFNASDSAPRMARCVILDDRADWDSDRPLAVPLKDSIIYELHVRGFTRHPSSGVRAPGTFRGAIEKIPYLKALGITAVELMPICEFNQNENVCRDPATGERLRNYWGYSTIAFFAPKASYADDRSRAGAVREFRELVKALHRAGIEVILDVVFNHTAEGDQFGPTLSFRGLDNPIYYMLAEDRRFYRNFSGCGNTINCNHPFVREFVLDCLRYWVIDMHVDGFRFDLASILGRAQDGSVLANPPLIERIAEDPILSKTKIIAEAWDAAGLFQVGSFPGTRWAEWNAHFRDDVRRFVRGDAGMVPAIATRIAGSSDLYEHGGRQPYHSINFITSHDGFPLADLVSYNRKHNERNGEGNRDGYDANWSWNCGVEGPTQDPSIIALRRKQAKNHFAILMLSQGVPMILMGDEALRTQGGNNNAYCQDNETSWFDWRACDQNADFLRFARLAIAFRRAHPILRRERFFSAPADGHPAEITWHGLGVGEPDWSPESRWIAFHLAGKASADPEAEEDTDLYVILNAHWEDRAFALPPPPAGLRWHRVADTSLPSPQDFLEPGSEEPLTEEDTYHAAPRSTVILLAKR
ncbi:MAG: glycogen debranching protein GlgX [Planctomycetes bacterium]|nr:glycogen debranching protein GlgX [Planctomycetota bacterium]